MTLHTYCRLCEGSCGLLADVAGDRLVALAGDPSDPVSRGYICQRAEDSVNDLHAPARLTQPMRRVDGALQPVAWDDALREIGGALRAGRSRGGARSVGLYLGDALTRNTDGMVRALAFAAGLGTPSVFSAQSNGAGARLRMSELMLGHVAPLLSDLGRAHYVVLLGGDQPDGNWGPMHAGMGHLDELRHSRRTKATKVVVADPRRTAVAAEMDQHLAIRPGTEPFLLLGMLSAVVSGGWVDQQYIRDYTSGYASLVESLADWPLDRCARICGIDPAVLSGVALKFSRAAMAVVHPGVGTFQNDWASIGAWAWLALHTVTANTLRPGGLYDHHGVFDLHYAAAAVPGDGAPRTRVGDVPLVLMQAPGAALADEVLVPGEGRVRALVCVSGDPVSELPGGRRMREALDDLELLVVIGDGSGEAASRADWVLPAAHSWERGDLHLLDCNLLPWHLTGVTPPLVAPRGEARLESDILRDLFEAVRPGVRGSSYGLHLTLLGRYLAGADLAAWRDRLVSWGLDDGEAGLESEAGRVDLGATDRSLWRVTTPDNRIVLLPAPIVGLLRDLDGPAAADDALWLRTTARVAGATGVGMHPDAGFADGATVRLSTEFGELDVVVRHDEALRTDVVDVPWGAGINGGELLSGASADPLVGTAVADGVRCRVVAG